MKILDPDNFLFTSDEHHGHDKLITGSEKIGSEKVRGLFRNSTHMSSVIIHNHNKVVSDKSIVCHIGDFSMMDHSYRGSYEKIMRKYKEVAHRMLIIGNHDRLTAHEYMAMGFDSIHTSLLLYYKDLTFVLTHDLVVATVCPSDWIIICGHAHDLFGKMISDMGHTIINVGVDVRNFTPIFLSDIIKML